MSKQRHKVWLHIGMPKTGTTSIQAALHGNRDVLTLHGRFYPDFQDFQHVALVRRLAREAGSPIPVPKKGDAGKHSRFLELVREEGAGAHTSIISSENFFQRPGCVPGQPPPPGVDPMDLLRKTIEKTREYLEGCDVTVVAWLRRQDGWLMSMYNQTIKSSRFVGQFDEYALNNVGANILGVIHLWIEAFGREKVVCKSYDALARRKLNVVDDFLDLVCPDIPRDAFRPVRELANPSLSIEGLWLKARINAALRESDMGFDGDLKRSIRKLVLDVSRSSPNPKRSLLSNAQRRALMARYLDGNRALVTDLGYSELAPLTDLSDLAGDSGESGLNPSEASLHSVERMILKLIIEAQAQDVEQA